jgi:DNA-directed RNA polymerase specialized sigma24 family protein
MDQDPPQPPGSTDLEGWRQAIANRQLSRFRLETLVAVLQDLGPAADPTVRNALAKHLSDAMTRLLRRLVGTNHPNRGDDIIYRVHRDMFEALLDPSSADGKALREAFTARISFRIKDAIIEEKRHGKIPVQVNRTTVTKRRKFVEKVRLVPPGATPDTANDPYGDGEEVPRRDPNRDPSFLHGVRDLDETIDLKRFLTAVPDERKRLAFYLCLDDVPFESKKGNSIARALGISSKTAREWVEEVRAALELNEEIQELQKASLGDNT